MVLLAYVSGLLAGFLSGLLGLGGGILLTPILLYAPQLFGLDGIPVKEITGLTMTQGLAGAVSGLVRHYSFGYVSWRLVGYMGASVAIFALIGALVSSNVPDGEKLAVFAGMALVASGLFLTPGPSSDDEVETFTFSAPLAVILGAAVGFTGGLVGQAGSFILIPLMVYVLKVPTRYAIGSNLRIILFAALAGLSGKLGTAQVPLYLSLALVGGAVPAAQAGAWVSRRAQPRILRYLLAGVVTSAAIAIWVDIIV